MSTGSRVLVTAFGAAVATTARGSVLCMHIPDPRGWFPDGSLTGAIVGTKTDEKEGLQVRVVGRPNGRVRAEIRVSTLPRRRWLSPASWATR